MNLEKLKGIQDLQNKIINDLSTDISNKKLEVIKFRLDNLGFAFIPNHIHLEYRENQEIYYYIPDLNDLEEKVRIVTFNRSIPSISLTEGFKTEMVYEETYY